MRQTNLRIWKGRNWGNGKNGRERGGAIHEAGCIRCWFHSAQIQRHTYTSIYIEASLWGCLSFLLLLQHTTHLQWNVWGGRGIKKGHDRILLLRDRLVCFDHIGSL